jgi:hypothetical protein
VKKSKHRQQHCAHCKVKFGGQPLAIPHYDAYHRKPLCQKCYCDPVIARATASNPDDPNSWWNDPSSDPEFEAQMAIARKTMKKRKKTLRELAHS